MNLSHCRIGEYYPDRPERLTDGQLAAIHARLARQWEAIAAGEEWDPDRPAEPILALLSGPLAWCRIPGMGRDRDGRPVIADWSPFHLNGELPLVTTWNRPDGLYITLSVEGANRLGARPVGLTTRRRREAREAGLTDAIWDVWERTRRTKRGHLRLRFLRPTKECPAANPMPLYRWARDTEAAEAQDQADPQTIGGEAVVSLDRVGTTRIPDPCCQAERERMFVRTDPETERLKRFIAGGVG